MLGGRGGGEGGVVGRREWGRGQWAVTKKCPMKDVWEFDTSLVWVERHCFT